MRVCTRCAHIKPVSCTSIHTSFLPSKPALSLRLPPGLRRDRCVVENHKGVEWNLHLVYLWHSVETCHRFIFPSHQLLFLGRDFVLCLEVEDESVESIDNSLKRIAHNHLIGSCVVHKGLGFALVVQFVHDHGRTAFVAWENVAWEWTCGI